MLSTSYFNKRSRRGRQIIDTSFVNSGVTDDFPKGIETMDLGQADKL